MKVAIVGSGISGLTAAHHLRRRADVTLFESGPYFGGHTHTVDVTLPSPSGDVTWGVDTGFLVFNDRTYPQLKALLAELKVPTASSEMSFSVQSPRALGQEGLEWSGNNLSSVFAQRSNLLSPPFWGMLFDILRFNRLCTQLATAGSAQALEEPLRAFLDRHRFGAAFRDGYFLPMLGCIWSCPTDQMLEFPVDTMIRFCHNHGLLQITDRPQWMTVPGGARQYVSRIIAGLSDARLNTAVQRIDRDPAGVTLHTAQGAQRFDRVILATHSDQALQLLAQPTLAETEVLGSIGYQANRAVLHTDESVLPRRQQAWAAWNYERAADPSKESQRVCLHYLLNRLQPLPFAQPVLVSLNPHRAVDPGKILGEFEYQHPVFDLKAIRAQQRLNEIQGDMNTWFSGAWTGYGFHEDGLKSGLAVVEPVLASAAPRRQAAA